MGHPRDATRPPHHIRLGFIQRNVDSFRKPCPQPQGNTHHNVGAPFVCRARVFLMRTKAQECVLAKVSKAFISRPHTAMLDATASKLSKSHPPQSKQTSACARECSWLVRCLSLKHATMFITLTSFCPLHFLVIIIRKHHPTALLQSGP